MVAQWERSDETAAEFARRTGISAATLSRWRREVNDAAAMGLPDPALAKIFEVRPAVASGGGDRFEVRLGDGRSVIVPPAFEGDALERLLRVLGVAR